MPSLGAVSEKGRRLRAGVEVGIGVGEVGTTGVTAGTGVTVTGAGDDCAAVVAAAEDADAGGVAPEDTGVGDGVGVGDGLGVAEEAGGTTSLSTLGKTAPSKMPAVNNT